MSDKLMDFALVVAEKAWLLSDGIHDGWFPKSQVEKNEDGTFTMPEWIAKAKGFL